MKKIVLALMAVVSFSAQAHCGYGYGCGYRVGGGGGWVGPAIIGGVIGYEIARPRYEQPVVVVQQPPVYVQQPAPAPTVPYGYHYTQILDANCNCYRVVLVPN
jgi:hypothetical protein